MKKFASILVITVFLVSSILPSYAQKSASRADDAAAFVKFHNTDAYSDGKGALVRWEMDSELGNVGFYVYRTGLKERQLVSDQMILGSAARTRNEVLFGEIYEIFDPQGKSGSSYVIESVMMSGRRTSSQIVSAKSASLQSVSGRSSDDYNLMAKSATERTIA